MQIQPDGFGVFLVGAPCLLIAYSVDGIRRKREKMARARALRAAIKAQEAPRATPKSAPKARAQVAAQSQLDQARNAAQWGRALANMHREKSPDPAPRLVPAPLDELERRENNVAQDALMGRAPVYEQLRRPGFEENFDDRRLDDNQDEMACAA